MSPVSLLFSSDAEMSRLLGQALRELDFDVEYCPEIFGAVEKLTSRSYDVVVADGNEGIEAMFVLKTTRELESNRNAFTIAVAAPDQAAAALQAGAELVISRPVVPQKAKHAMLTCKAFVDHMPAWLPKLGFTVPGEKPASAPITKPAERPWPIITSSEPPVHIEPALTFEDDFIPNPAVQKAFSSAVRADNSAAPRNWGRVGLRIAAFVVATLSLSYALSQPTRTQSVVRFLGGTYTRALDRTRAWLHRHETTVQASTETPVTEEITLAPPQPPSRVEHMRHIRERTPVSALTESTELSPALAIPVTTDNSPLPNLQIPDSLHDLPQSAQAPAVKNGVSLATALEPIDLPEEMARKLLVETVIPKYPEEALHAGMQGPVVLQAWIGRDGSVLDLKLIRGSFLLGKAAYQAVKQWRFQPYIRNGRALQAQTYITVNFKLP
jgi:periplasmic protein TonB